MTSIPTEPERRQQTAADLVITDLADENAGLRYTISELSVALADMTHDYIVMKALAEFRLRNSDDLLGLLTGAATRGQRSRLPARHPKARAA
jgi:hypothetical protein